MRYRCPVCKDSMSKMEIRAHGIYHRCPDHGVWMPLSFLRSFKGGREVSRAIESGVARKTSLTSDPISCPNCFKRMMTVFVAEPVSSPLDHCPTCRSIWFDVGELERVPDKGELEKEFPQAPISERYVLESKGLAPLAPTAEQLRENPIIDGNGEFHPLHILGLPTEIEATEKSRETPVATIFVVLGSILMTGAFVKNSALWEKWIFHTEMPLEHMGLNWITSFFFHAGWFHCLSNMYFLWVCGNDVEDEIGSGHFLILLAVGAAGGHLATIALAAKTGVQISSLGASGGVSAALSYYAFAFPRHRMQQTLFTSLFTKHSFSISSGMFLLIFVLKELGGAVTQLSGGSSGINHLAHLAGVLAGVVFFYGFPRSQQHWRN